MGIHMGEVGMICQYQLKKNVECFNMFACYRILIKGVVADGFTTLACGIACRMIYSHSPNFLFLEFLDLKNKHSLPGWTLSRRIMLPTSNALKVTNDGSSKMYASSENYLPGCLFRPHFHM
jgi:hypothetical protein